MNRTLGEPILFNDTYRVTLKSVQATGPGDNLDITVFPRHSSAKPGPKIEAKAMLPKEQPFALSGQTTFDVRSTDRKGAIVLDLIVTLAANKTEARFGTTTEKSFETSKVQTLQIHFEVKSGSYEQKAVGNVTVEVERL